MILHGTRWTEIPKKRNDARDEALGHSFEDLRRMVTPHGAPSDYATMNEFAMFYEWGVALCQVLSLWT